MRLRQNALVTLQSRDCIIPQLEVSLLLVYRATLQDAPILCGAVNEL